MKVLLLDNNDSFTHNIVELLRQIDVSCVEVIKSDEIVMEQVVEYEYIIFSPGPSIPDDFPAMREILKRYDSTKKILGICLGHQAICHYYGARLVNMPCVLHGVPSVIECSSDSHLFKGLNTTTVGRYHSWAVDDIPCELTVTAIDENGVVMAVEHKTKSVYGVQFHPESYISSDGRKILSRFIYD